MICPAVRLYVVAPPQGGVYPIGPINDLTMPHSYPLLCSQHHLGAAAKSKKVSYPFTGLSCAAPECSAACPGREAYRLILKQAHLGKDSSTIDPDPCLAARDFRVHTEAQQRAPMYDGRLPLADNLGPGAALYHPAFAKMWHTLSSDQNLSQVRVDADMEDSVWELRRALCRMDVRDEEESLDTLKKHFSRLFPGTTFHKKYSVLRDGKLVAALDFAVTCSTPYGVEAVIVAGAAGPTQALYGYRRASLAEGVSKTSRLRFLLPETNAYISPELAYLHVIHLSLLNHWGGWSTRAN